MDKVSKMRASLSKGLKPRDTLIPTAPSPEVAYSKPPQTSEYTEITTLPLSKEQKALIEDLGTKLQRQKTEQPKKQPKKQPGLNWKSILRGMIGLLDEHTFDGVSVANEEELHQVIKKKFGR